jgi:hypothetical protein
MPKVRNTNLEEFDNTPTLEKLKARAKRHKVKTERATEALLEDMSEQNKKLSQQNLILTKLYRACYRLLPESARSEIDNLRKDIDSLENLEVHP